MEDGGVLIGGRAVGRPGGGQAGRRTDGLEARRRALLNLRVKGAVELPLLIVHLTQDHVVLQEEFVSHTKPGKSEQERQVMEGSQRAAGAPRQNSGGLWPQRTQLGWSGPWDMRSWGACFLKFPEGTP